ncbi:hypothetical protein B0H14DRAFT_3759125 [Mycena olivaceomarginata]|nr:hypothetical protein B0H14DRAFT_3759125 [Mycena olivaceomarginata]
MLDGFYIASPSGLDAYTKGLLTYVLGAREGAWEGGEGTITGWVVAGGDVRRTGATEGAMEEIEREVRKTGEWREEEGRSRARGGGRLSSVCAYTTRLRRAHAAPTPAGVTIRAADRSAPVCDCAWGWQGAAGRDRAEMGKKRGGDGAKGEEGKERGMSEGGRSKGGWKVQRHAFVSAPQAESRNERRTYAVVQWRLNGVASMSGSRVGRDVHGSL